MWFGSFFVNLYAFRALTPQEIRFASEGVIVCLVVKVKITNNKNNNKNGRIRKN